MFLGGDPVPAVLRTCTESSVQIEMDGVLRTFSTHRVGSTWYIDSVLGHSALVEMPRFPEATKHEDAGSLLSPMPGKVAGVLVTEGENVSEGRVLVVIEAMKMEHSVRSPVDGRVTAIKVDPGDQVDAGQVLIVVEEDAPVG